MQAAELPGGFLWALLLFLSGFPDSGSGFNSFPLIRVLIQVLIQVLLDLKDVNQHPEEIFSV